MICETCQNDLCKCTCANLEQRFEKILQIPQLYVAREYQERVRAQIKRNKQQKSISEMSDKIQHHMDIEIPPEILNAARIVDEWARIQGLEFWCIDGVASRNFEALARHLKLACKATFDSHAFSSTDYRTGLLKEALQRAELCSSL